MERWVNDLMRQAVKLNHEMRTSRDLPEDVHVHAQSAMLGLMAIYSHLTGLPAPWDARAAEMGWNKV